MARRDCAGKLTQTVESRIVTGQVPTAARSIIVVRARHVAARLDHDGARVLTRAVLFTYIPARTWHKQLPS